MKKMRQEKECELDENYFFGYPTTTQTQLSLIAPPTPQQPSSQLPIQLAQPASQLPVQQIVIQQPVMTISAADLQQLELTSQPVVAAHQVAHKEAAIVVTNSLMGFSMPNLISPMKEANLQQPAVVTGRALTQTTKITSKRTVSLIEMSQVICKDCSLYIFVSFVAIALVLRALKLNMDKDINVSQPNLPSIHARIHY